MSQAYRISWFSRWFADTRGGVAVVDSGGVTIEGRRYPHGDWTVESCFLWNRIRREGVPSFLLGPSDSQEFLEWAGAWHQHVEVAPQVSAASRLLAEWDELAERHRYFARHEVEQWAARARVTYVAVYPALSALERVTPKSEVFRFAKIAANPHAGAEQANDRFVRAEMIGRRGYFDAMKPVPSEAQREIAIRDETNVLVVAGAGTGKTATIVTKLRYLVESGQVAAADVLVVAFNHDAAAELRARLEAKGIAGVTTRTFHALGLQVLGHGSGEKPPLLAELSTDESREDVIAGLVDGLSADPAFGEDFARFVYLYAQPYPDRFAARSEQEHISRTKNVLSKSAQGEWVRSIEELRIANWLYAHGINYTYEEPYPHAAGSNGYTRYRPDFTLRIPDEDGTSRILYLEHQALDEKGHAPGWAEGYVEKVRWKRQHHRDHGTTLLESFSWWFAKGVWERELRKVLENAKVAVPAVNWRQKLRELKAQEGSGKEFDWKFALSLVRRALDLERSGGKPQPMPASDSGRLELFDRIFARVKVAYEEYKRRKQGIDFEDMISEARRLVEAGKFTAPWTHYIIDEYQDASLSRLALIQAMRRQRPDSRLTCVGDDWQAIIRFAGGDIRVMTEFEQRVGPHWMTRLEQSYRYSGTIAKVSTSFIARNPSQLLKRISPAPKRRDRPIRLVYGSGRNEQDEFADVLYSELERLRREASQSSVLLLSRYRRGVPALREQDEVRARFPELKLTWHTAHAAKGLEADSVIVADLDDHAYGFPCTREDDPIIFRLLPPVDQFEHAEERRLFYVAMTRAKENLVLLSNALAPSPFVRELVASCPDELEVVNVGTPAKMCSKCGAGYLVARDGPTGRFFSCTKSPVCNHTENACPKCRRGFLIRHSSGRHYCSQRDRGCSHEAIGCPRCQRGWLEVRTNRQTQEDFLGCNRFWDEEPCRYTQNFGTRRTARRVWR